MTDSPAPCLPYVNVLPNGDVEVGLVFSGTLVRTNIITRQAACALLRELVEKLLRERS